MKWAEEYSKASAMGCLLLQYLLGCIVLVVSWQSQRYFGIMEEFCAVSSLFSLSLPT